MASSTRRAGPLRLSACGLALVLASASARAAEEPAHSAALDEAIIKSAARHGVPEKLVRRIVMRESRYNPEARNHKYWGLMQISYPTAKSMGFRGSPQELLNPVVNLRYAVPYLANAFIIAGKREDAAIRLYASGYYDTAKRRGLLSMLRTADSTPLHGAPDDADMVASVAPAPPPEDTGIFGALFGPSQMPRDAQSQQTAYASVAPQTQSDAQPAQQAVAEMPDGKSSDDVDLVADKTGTLHPPKAWQKDGGSTVIARGEQSIEQVAAYEKAADAPETQASRRHHSHKTTVFASLDAPPAGAQAYAAVAGGQDPRLMQAESQAAIAQATAGQQAAGQPAEAAPPGAAAGTESAPAAGQPQAAAQTSAPDEPSKQTRKRHVARKARHHAAPDAPDSTVAAAQPQSTGPTQATPDAAPDPQPAPTQAADASAVQPAPEAAAPQPQQADEDADTQTSRKHRHHAHRGHGHKTTDVASKASDDGKAQAQPAQPAAQ